MAGSRLGYNIPVSWDLIGHGWAVSFLQEHLRKGGLRHAYLFTGPDGVGKRTLAAQLAQVLLCAEEIDTFCGSCRACREVASERHPDLHVVQSEQGETTLRVEQIRELQRAIALTPYQAQRRVVMILRAHEMSREAANALLKTLEEPPAESVLLLTARSKESLLETIVSRCAVLPLRPVRTEVLEAGLQERVGDPADAALLAGLAAGRPGVALQLAQDEAALTRRRGHVEDLRKMLSASRIERFEFADALVPKKDAAAERERAQEMLETWLGVWRDVMLAAHGAQDAALGAAQLVDIGDLAGSVSPREAASVTRALESAMVGLSVYANLQLTLEAALLKLPYLSSGR